jgi:hypothetical protein
VVSVTDGPPTCGALLEIITYREAVCGAEPLALYLKEVVGTLTDVRWLPIKENVHFPIEIKRDEITVKRIRIRSVANQPWCAPILIGNVVPITDSPTTCGALLKIIAHRKAVCGTRSTPFYLEKMIASSRAGYRITSGGWEGSSEADSRGRCEEPPSIRYHSLRSVSGVSELMEIPLFAVILGGFRACEVLVIRNGFPYHAVCIRAVI